MKSFDVVIQRKSKFIAHSPFDFHFMEQDNFENWKTKLFNKRDFRETDRVCERHFDRSQILTHWEHIIDGKLCQLEREKPKIRANAIPYLNLPETEDLAQIVNKKRGPKEARKRKQNLNTSDNSEKVTHFTLKPFQNTYSCVFCGR